MAAIAKFVSYDGGIAFSDSVMLIKKGNNAPSHRIPHSDVASLNVRKPQEDTDGFIRVTTTDGQRYRIFFEDDQFREAVQFKKQYDAFLAELDEEDKPDTPYPDGPEPYPVRQYERGRASRAPGGAFPMTTWKLVAGILSIALSMFVFFQSCAAGIGNTLEGNSEVGGSAGVIVAILLLAGGIVSIAVRKGSKGGNIALVAMFTLAAIVGFVLAGSYSDLKIWSAWCLVNALLALISLLGSSQSACGGRGNNQKLYLLAVGAVVLVGAIVIICSLVGGPKKTSDSASGADVSVSQPLDNTTSIQQASGPIQLGDYAVEIKDAYKASDYDEKPVIVINYAWTNNSSDTTCAEVALSETAFQDGVELEPTSLPDNAYDSWAEIRPGTSLDVNAVFILRSESPVEFEISELFSFSDQAATKTFDLNSIP